PALALSAAATLAAAALLCADDTWMLQRRILRGASLSAEEEYEKAYDFRRSAGGLQGDPGSRTSVTGHTVEKKLRRWVQRVVEAGPEGEFRIDRKYEKSLKVVSKPGSDKKDSYATALQGKVVHITGSGGGWDVNTDAYDLMGEDREDVSFSEQIYALLPKRAVKVGDQWTLKGDEIGPLFFPNEYNPEGFRLKAYGLLKQITRYQDRDCAHIGLSLQLDIQKTDQSAGQKFDIKGYAFFSLEDGAFLEIDLAGPMSIDQGIEGEERFTATGTWRIKVRSKVLAKGEPPTTPTDSGDDGSGGGGEGGDEPPPEEGN
ncbi:MAG: hypothetical protein HZA54_20700, partial [Planctomycetes bacterium]|nr:hypothetical protein [Planctomycetota bacterium]